MTRDIERRLERLETAEERVAALELTLLERLQRIAHMYREGRLPLHLRDAVEAATGWAHGS